MKKIVTITFAALISAASFAGDHKEGDKAPTATAEEMKKEEEAKAAQGHAKHEAATATMTTSSEKK